MSECESTDDQARIEIFTDMKVKIFLIPVVGNESWTHDEPSIWNKSKTSSGVEYT